MSYDTKARERDLDELLKEHENMCAMALAVIEQKGKRVAEFLRDKVGYKA
jgi:hypothetical protein